MRSPAQKTIADDEFADLLASSLEGDREALARLVSAMTPVVHVRVARALRRRQHEARGRALRQECEDLVQEVFAALFDQRAKALRTWDPARGLNFLSFVGFLAEREVGMRLRSQKRNPWTEEPTAEDRLALVAGAGRVDGYLESRDMLARMLDELKSWLTPEGRQYFELLYVEERPVAEVAEAAGTTAEALYAWRSRLVKKMRRLRDELAAEGHDGG